MRELVVRILKLLSMCATAGLLTGCATVLQQLQFSQPSLSLESIQVTGFSFTGGSVDLILDVFNPNSYDLNTTRVEAGIDLEGTHFGDVSWEEPVTLPSGQHTTVRVPLSFTWSGVGAGARGLLAKGAVNYVLGTRLFLDTPLGERAVEFETTGEVPLLEMVGR